MADTMQDAPGWAWREAEAKTVPLVELARGIDPRQGLYEVILGTPVGPERLAHRIPRWYVTVERGGSRRVAFSSGSPVDIEAFLRSHTA